MKRYYVSVFVVFAATVLFPMLSSGVEPEVYSPHGASFTTHMNMGPTGATAWMRGFHLQIMGIAEGSPADGRLMLGDLVIGVDETLFGSDAGFRKPLGDAIGRSEASGEPLTLVVVRGDQRINVSIPLPAIGAFHDGWPSASCSKSEQILDAACQYLLQAQLPDGRIVTDGNVGTHFAGLLFLASGNPEYLDAARRAAYQVASVDYDSMDLKNWALGYGGMLLAEYYLSTGDTSVLEELQVMVDMLARGQMKSGSWGHNIPGGGYGNLNQPGIVCAIALVLADECGVDVDKEAREKAIAFFSRYAMTGAVPYGDHLPRGLPDNNGTSASAAVFMQLAGLDAEAQAFGRSVALSLWGRELGHTGGMFSMIWGAIGVALTAEDSLDDFMAAQSWYYNLIRSWDGSLVLLPYYEALTRFDGSSYVQSGGEFTTGGLALSFALPHRKLRILGAAPSVFSPHAELSASLVALRDLYLNREWSNLDEGVDAIDPASLRSDEQRGYLQQLVQAREDLLKSMDRTILEIQSNLDNQHGFRASQQFEALQRVTGEEADARYAILAERFADGGVAWNVREGERFWDAWATLKAVSIMSWTAQGRWARELLEPMPSLRVPIWEPLVEVMSYGPQQWRSFYPDSEDDLPPDWNEVGFAADDWVQGEKIVLAGDADVSSDVKPGAVAARNIFTVEDTKGATLRVRLQTVRPAVTRVYLNGEMVVDAVRGQRGGYAFIELDAAALELLHVGTNVLAVYSSEQGKNNNRLDVGLDIARRLPQRKHLRIDRIDTVAPVDLIEIDDTLRVREAGDLARAALQEKYDNLPVPVLLEKLHDPVAYIRDLAGNALVGEGNDAIQSVLAMADDTDWKVRSSVCQIIRKAYDANTRDALDITALLIEQLPVLIDMLDDEHYWVRTQAAVTLRKFDDVSEAAPALMACMSDENDWVRLEALRSLRSLTSNSNETVQAAMVALRDHTYSAYSLPKIAFGIIKDSGELDAAQIPAEEKLPVLLHLLENPPEGDGRFLLNQVMDYAFTLDPEGTQLIPVLIDAAADKTHMSRIRQNPRGHAIEVLGSYGDKAVAALPELQAIVDQDADGEWHEVAQEAMNLIKERSQ